MGILTAQEHSQLTYVGTTVPQAEQIRDRNLGLLDALDEMYRDLKIGVDLDDYSIQTYIGCPHCDEMRGCGDCSWFGRLYRTGSCTYQTFGGISYRSLCGYLLMDGQDDSRLLSVVYADSDESIEYDPDGEGDLDDQYLECRTFLLGHLEWAATVIERGDIG
jgi:hypothetical protein